MGETGESIEEESTNVTEPTDEHSALNAYVVAQHEGRTQERPSTEQFPPVENTSSYFSESSASSAAVTPPVNKSVIDNPGVVTPGNEIPESRNTIENSAKIPPIVPRKDSDDISLSKIKPVHNFFGQHQYYPDDSDGSDGSLVFSPVSVGDDHKTATLPGDSKDVSSSRGTGTLMGKRNDSATSFSSRTRFGSVDSVASNGSIRYVRPSQNSPANASTSIDSKQNNGQSQPINPQLLPYNERRKLIQQRQHQEQHQQYQQYHAAMMHAHSQSSQQQQGHTSHLSAPPYTMDPRMAGSYYQMYGIPPPGIYAQIPPQHVQHQSGGVPVNAYPFVPPLPGMPYYPMPSSNGASHGPSDPQLHPSIHQFQHHSSTTGYQQQPYPSPLMNSHQVPAPLPSPYHNNPAAPIHPSMPPQFSYLPPPPMTVPLQGDHPSEQKPQQEKHSLQYKEQQKTHSQPGPQSTPNRSRYSVQGPESSAGIGASAGVSTGTKSVQSLSSTKISSTKNNPPRLPPTTARRGSGGSVGALRDTGASSTIPPPPLPQSHVMTPPGGHSLYHSRADSYGSLSSLGSQGLGSGSFSKDEDDDYPHNPPGNRDSFGNENRKDSGLSTPKSKRPTKDTSMVLNAPETPPQQAGHTRKSSFLDMLRMNWSPQSRNSPSSSSRKKLNIGEFHRKNQEFLNRATNLPPIQKAPTASTISTMNHRRVGSQDRPPASRGTHRRLQSISNDEWDDGDDDKSSGDTDNSERYKDKPTLNPLKSSESEEMSNSETCTDEDRFTTDDDIHDQYDYENVNEFSSLLPPSGISSNEQEGKSQKYDRKSRRSRQHYDATSSTRRNEHKRTLSSDFNQILSNMSVSDSSGNTPGMSDSTATLRWDNRISSTARKGRKKKYRHKNSKYSSNSSSESSQESSDSNFDHRKWTKKRARMLEKERAKLIEQWKAEAREEAELLRKEEEANRWYRRLCRSTSDKLRRVGIGTFRCLTLVENFIGNLPLTIGAVALAVVTLGVVWFKFAEEYLETCEPVHFHSSQCTFPEFPGCFYCDKSALGYKIAIGFHYTCTIISGLFAMLLVAKILLATRVVIDEMSSPTTSSPAGLLCMTAVCVFAGRGMVGQVIVSTAACIHLVLAIWFIYMALAYNIMPEPSWFPNTIGIGLSAVKTWLYYPMPGHLLMAISLSLNFFFFPISLIRVVVNKKISATVAWMQMSAPAVSLYALTIMAQPSFEEEQPDVTNFQRVHRMVYLPCMHVMCALSLLGMAASLHSLYDRWTDFKRKEFSPAHAAFCFPTLSHANSIQAYRGAVRSFSQLPDRSWRMFLLDAYWFVVLVGGTVATFWICGKFLYKLPEWTSPDLSNEEEPPAPYETLLSQQQMVTAGDTLTQNFVSPAILQANETGALVLSRSARDGTLRYVRTRRIRALGFEPTMNWSEIQEEEEKLLEWVGKHPPRRRHRTLSVPGIDFNYGSSRPAFGTGNSGVYGTYSPSTLGDGRKRSLSQGQQSSFFK